MTKEQRFAVYVAVVQAVVPSFDISGETPYPGIGKIADHAAMVALEFIRAADEKNVIGR